MDFHSRSGQLLGGEFWQGYSQILLTRHEWPAWKSKGLAWPQFWETLGGWMSGHTGNISQFKTNRKISAGAAFVSQRGCRSMSRLPIWKYGQGEPSLSLFPPPFPLHFSPTSLSPVHSEAGVFEEAWSHFPDSATGLMTAGWCQLCYWSKMNGLSVCIGPGHVFSTVQEVMTELTFLPTVWIQPCRLSFAA